MFDIRDYERIYLEQSGVYPPDGAFLIEKNGAIIIASRKERARWFMKRRLTNKKAKAKDLEKRKIRTETRRLREKLAKKIQKPIPKPKPFTEKTILRKNNEMKAWKMFGLSKERPTVPKEQAEKEKKMIEEFIVKKPEGYKVIPIQEINPNITGRLSGCQGL